MKNQRTPSRCVGGAMLLASLLLSASAFGYDQEIKTLSKAMAEKIAGKGKQTVAVVDFNDLEGNVTQLDRFIAEEFSVALAGAGKGFKVIDRTHLKAIIKENKLSATGLIDPATIKKLGKIVGVDALVTGTLTPFGDNMHLAVKILDTETAEVIDATTGDIAKTKAIEEMLGKEIEPAKTIINHEMHTGPILSHVRKVEKEGVVFELSECRLNDAGIKCFIIITNNGADRDSVIGNGYTEMFDNIGNRYDLSSIQINNKISKDGIRLRFIPGARLEAVVSFDGSFIKEDVIPLLEIGVSIPVNNNLKIPLKRVHLS